MAFQPGEGGNTNPACLDAKLLLRETLPHPDLEPFIGNGARGIAVREQDLECHVEIPGEIDGQRAVEIEEAIWEKLHFANHLRSQRLGEFTIGIDLHRSESLALVQLIILYEMVMARAAISLGGDSPREQHAAESAGEPPRTDETSKDDAKNTLPENRERSAVLGRSATAE